MVACKLKYRAGTHSIKPLTKHLLQYLSVVTYNLTSYYLYFSYWREIFTLDTVGLLGIVQQDYIQKVNVYLPSLMMKVPDHLYVLGDTYTCHT
jgi:hypothetical protein